MEKNQDKILLIGWDGSGGADTVVKGLKNGFEERGTQNKILYHNFGKRPYLQTPTGTQEFRDVNDFIESGLLPEYMTIHSHLITFTGDEIVKMRRQSSQAPLIYTAHSIAPHDILNSNAANKKIFEGLPPHVQARQLENMKSSQLPIVRESDKVTNMTRVGEEIYRRYFPEYAQKSILIPNGSDIYKMAERKDVAARAAELRQKFGNGTMVLYTGRLHKDKGVLDLADAFSRAKETKPELKLVYVGGSPDPSVPDVIKSRVKPEYRNDVFFEGWINDRSHLASEYMASDMVVLPSYYESFGLSALEGMMLGKPVIASDIDGMGDVFVKPWYAYGVQPGNVPQLQERLNYVASNPVEAQRNADRVKDAVVSRYSSDKIIDGVLGLYITTMVENMFRNPNTNITDIFGSYLKSIRYQPRNPDEMKEFGRLCLSLGEISEGQAYRDIGKMYMQEAGRGA